MEKIGKPTYLIGLTSKDHVQNECEKNTEPEITMKM